MTAKSLDGRKLATARLWAASRMPYLASVLFASIVEADPDSRMIGIDQSWRIHADPALVDRLDTEQLGRLLLHLAGHAIRDHAGRAQRLAVADDDQRGRWNRCGDAEINDDLVATDCVPDVAPDLPASLGCAEGGLAERYYRDASNGLRHWDCGSGADGYPRSCDGASGELLSAGQRQLLRLGIAAEIQRLHAQEPGTIAGGWLRWAESVRPSRVDWRRVLAAEVRSAMAAVAGSSDYTYRKPSRRTHVASDVVLPSLFRPVPDVAIVCDVSGSMHERLLARALAEVEGVLKRGGLRQARVRVLSVDTVVHAVRRVSRAADVQLVGGGGTDMGMGIAAAASLRPQPSVIVVLTDGFTPWPAAPPRRMRVIVGLLTQGLMQPTWSPPPWARTVRIDDEPAMISATVHM